MAYVRFSRLTEFSKTANFDIYFPVYVRIHGVICSTGKVMSFCAKKWPISPEKIRCRTVITKKWINTVAKLRKKSLTHCVARNHLYWVLIPKNQLKLKRPSVRLPVCPVRLWTLLAPKPYVRFHGPATNFLVMAIFSAANTLSCIKNCPNLILLGSVQDSRNITFSFFFVAWPLVIL